MIRSPKVVHVHLKINKLVGIIIRRKREREEISSNEIKTEGKRIREIKKNN